MVNIACVGAGVWGKNLIRNFNSVRDARLRAVCDTDKKKLQGLKAEYPDVEFTQDFDSIIDDRNIDAVIIASSCIAHYELALKALLGGKNVFIEKPMALKVAHAEKLVKTAERLKKKIMVGHLMEYHPGIVKLKEIINSGELGEILYISSQRMNLGRVRRDENVVWSLAPHDISMILLLLGEEPSNVLCIGDVYLQKKVEDVAFIHLGFKGRKSAFIHLSWIDPHKTRKLTVVGSDKMVVFDDMETMEKLKIYDKDTAIPDYAGYGGAISLRFGDIRIPRIEMKEPLRIECQHFIDCIKKDLNPKTDGYDGLRVLKILAAAQKSMEKKGSPVRI